ADEVQLGGAIGGLEQGEGVRRVGGARTVRVDAREGKAWVVDDGQLGHTHAVRYAADRLALLVWRLARRQEQHPFQPEDLAGLLGRGEMAVVRRVERPAQHAQAAHVHSSSLSPITTVSPELTPARSNAWSTPIRASRRCSSAAASSWFRS